MHDLRVTDWNFLTVCIVVALFLLWNLELVANLLDRKAEPLDVPELLKGVMDQSVLEKGRAYRSEAARFGMIRSTVQLTLLLGFWGADGFDFLDQWARSVAGEGIVGGLFFIGIWFLAQTLIALPFDLWDTFVLEQKFGFNRVTPATFVMDRVKALVLMVLLGGALTAGLLWIFSHLAHAWLWAWVVIAFFQLAMVWLGPTWILPMFNRFIPMEDGPLREQIEQLGDRCGFPVEGVYVMDGSKRSSKANAFFTGIGKTKKIALYDTLLETCETKEIIAVLAHEIGHFRCGHIRQRLWAGMVHVGALCFLLGLCTDAEGFAARFVFDAFGVERISPAVGLVLFGILFSPVSLLLGMAMNAWSRKHEFEADTYAVRVTGSANELADALCRMTKDHLSHPTPSPLRVILDHSHPPLLQRVTAMRAS